MEQGPMLDLLRPDRYFRSLYDVDFDQLIAAGIRGIVFDLDNTLVAWGDDSICEELVSTVARLKQLGLKMCIVSNNLGGRVGTISRALRIPAASGALKPFRRAYARALEILGTESGETALIGDQLFTDILGGNLAGFHTILVDPIGKREFPTTRVVRWFERIARRRLGLAREDGRSAPPSANERSGRVREDTHKME